MVYDRQKHSFVEMLTGIYLLLSIRKRVSNDDIANLTSSIQVIALSFFNQKIGFRNSYCNDNFVTIKLNFIIYIGET